MVALIIDDEKNTRLTILSIIDFAQYGFDTVLEATNGQDGYRLIMQYKPSLVFLDMNMPKTDGSQLLQLVQNPGYDLNIIVISGYPDIRYAQAAVRNRHVLDYLSKPIDHNALISAVSRATGILLPGRGTSSSSASASASASATNVSQEKTRHTGLAFALLISDRRRCIREKFVSSNDLFLYYVEDVIRSFLSSVILYQPDSTDLAVIYGFVEEETNGINGTTGKTDKTDGTRKNERIDSTGKTDTTDRARITDKTDNTVKTDKTDRTGITDRTDKTIPCLQSSGEVMEQAFCSIIAKLQCSAFHPRILYMQRTNAVFPECCSIFGSRSGEILMDPKECVQELPQTACDTVQKDYSMLLEECQKVVMQSPSDEEGPAQMDKTVSELLQTLLQTLLQMQCTLQDLLKFIEALVHAMDQLFHTDTLQLTGLAAYSISLPVYDQVMQEHFKAWLCEYLTMLKKQYQDIGYPESLRQILGYINTHYDEDISLEVLSRVFFFHPSTISKLFTRYLHTSYATYVNEVRLQAAANMLHDPSIRLTEVSEKAGYDSVNYFIRVFKKKFGCTPQLYRKRFFPDTTP